ncbi:hypothetical protein [Cognaticolwellia aestuarii]|uniref:hypothetical protein n=1 Tax=Cognaticolwellia aestuarii TaxID=329993 RepID=UPI0009840BFE|nr:hypothetical protein [Cognaticolwellia aestuarii]
MAIEHFINEKITQIRIYINAVINHTLHYTELDLFVEHTMSEWTLLNVSDETPSSARERVFWHIMHELSLHSSKKFDSDLYFKSEISTCLEFFAGIGSYPIDCVGWRPLP